MISVQYPLPLPYQEAMEAEDLMVTHSNRAALAWLDLWPAWPHHCFVIYGPVASGKTHLMNIWRQRASARPMHVSELKSCDLSYLAAELQAVAIDDAEEIAGDAKGEENLLHLYNLLQEKKGSMLLASLEPPAHWGLKLKDLSSRLRASSAVALLAPDDDLLGGLLIKQFRDRQLKVEADVIEFILRRLTRSPAAMRHFVADLDAASLAENRRISVPLARRVFDQSQDGRY